jgi:hypothetical protein
VCPSQISLLEIIPCRGDGRLVVTLVLNCFFDGSNKSDSREYDHVTLAAMAAPMELWEPFEVEWKENLYNHGADWLHTTDAAVGNSPYSRDEGWDRKRINRFVRDCVKLARKYVALPITSHSLGRLGIFPYTVTVNLKDYLRARENAEDVPESVDEILATQAINACFEFGRDYGSADLYSLIWDQNEPYRGHIVDRIRNKKSVQRFPYFRKIISNSEADMKYFPALQLADLYAYCYGRKRINEPKFTWEKNLLEIPHNDAYANYEKLIKPNPEVVHLTRAMRFPKRAKTR